MYLLWFLLSYLAGSIPFGYLIAKNSKIDIRKHGSGNIGTTNITRVMGFQYGLAVLFLDTLKGYLPVILSFYVYQDTWLFDQPTFSVLMGIFAVLGHSKPIWLRFYGGKGVATGLGTMIGIASPVALIGFLTFLLFFLPTRYVSLGSLAGAISVPISMLLLQQPLAYYIYGCTITVLIIILHRGNIYRLRNGIEAKLHFKRGR